MKVPGLKNVFYAFRVSVVAGIMIFVAMSHFGCEEEPSAPASCGKGPFSLDSKTNICIRLSDNAHVDSDCCNY